FDARKPCCTPTSRSYVYDPAMRRWSTLPAMPQGGVTHAGTATDGRRVWLAGGYVADARGTGQVFGSRAVWQFDTLTRSWSRVADLPAARASGGLAHVGGRLHF